MNEHYSLFIETDFGFGQFGFIYSILRTVSKRTSVLKIDTSEIITKQQLDDKIKSDTGLDIATLIELSIIKENEYTFIIFDNITNDMNSEALNYLRQIPITSNQFNKSTFYIFISNFSIKQFNDIKVRLKSLSVNETRIILRKTLPQQNIPEYDIQLIHDYSVVTQI